jgi:hypothetical protein
MGVEIRDFSFTAAKEQGANEIACPDAFLRRLRNSLPSVKLRISVLAGR